MIETQIGVVDFTATNVKLDAQNALLTQLLALLGNTDQLEGLVGNTNTLLATQAAYLDQVEALLTTLGTYEDGVEGLLSTLGVKNDSLLAKLEAVRLQLTTAAQEARTPADGAAYYVTARDGSAATRLQLSTLKAGIKTLEILAKESDVWFVLGDATVTSLAPTADTTSAPRLVLQRSSLLINVGSATHIALAGNGFGLAWWTL